MKKALTITIAGTLFTIEEDAYQELDGYLKSIQKYFGNYPDSSEIINDIEARIAEQLLDRKTTSTVVTITDVEALIKVMGRVEDIAGETSERGPDAAFAGENTEYQSSPRKLYRNIDDMWVMGVASGIAAYLDIDPIIVRILFIILAFITAFVPTIIFYFILGIFIPAAKTPAQKIQMRGGPIDLKSFKNSMNEYAENIKQKGSDFFANSSNPQSRAGRALKGVGAFIQSIVKIVFSILGFLIKLIATVGIIFATFVFISLIFKLNLGYIDFPLAEVTSRTLYYVLITLGYLAVILPLSLVSMIGSIALRRKKPNALYGAIGIIGTWFAVILIIATLSVRVLPDIREKVNALPEYQTVSTTTPLTGFTKVDLQGIDTVKFTQAPDFSIVSSGRQFDIDRTQFSVEQGTLVLKQRSHEGMCIFCIGKEKVDITIAAPSVDGISVSGVTELTGAFNASTTVTIALEDAARADLEVVAPRVEVVTRDVGQLTLTGAASDLKVTTEDASRVSASGFAALAASAESSDVSRATVKAVNTLNAIAHDVSRILYIGSPVLTQDASDMARIEQSN